MYLRFRRDLNLPDQNNSMVFANRATTKRLVQQLPTVKTAMSCAYFSFCLGAVFGVARVMSRH